MSAGTIPIQTCDADTGFGCDEYMIDNYAMLATNWRELLDGWTYDPATDRALCPEHNGGTR